MLLVYEMKNTLSIGEIKRILQNVYALPEYDAAMLERIYRRYLEIKENERESTCGLVCDFMKQTALDAEDEADFFTLLLGLAAMSSYLKNTVQILLEHRYPDLNAEKTREEQERKEEEKRKKAEQKAELKRQKAQKDVKVAKPDAIEEETV